MKISCNDVDIQIASKAINNGAIVIFTKDTFYGLGCNDNYIYGTDVVDYVQQGWSFRHTENGVAVDSVRVGIIPGGYCFN